MPDDRDNPNGNPSDRHGGDPDSQMLERKLATILSADVAEYSRLMGEDEEGTLRAFRGHKQVFESLVAMHRGRIFNTAGDAILAEFQSAVEAVRCATDIQAALRTRNDQLPPNRQVRFRIGINLGDVMVQGQDLMGDGVNVAARIQTAAEPGGVCISGSVHDQIRNKLSLSFHSLGEKSFKNIQQPVRTFAVSEYEADAGDILPAPTKAATPVPPRSSPIKWIVAAVVLFLAGGGYWAYTTNHRSKIENTTAVTLAVATAVTQSQTNPPATTPQPGTAMTAAQPSQPPTPPPTTPPTSAAAGSRASSGATGNAANPASHAHPPHASATPAAATAVTDGTYSGPICFAKTLKEPNRCFRVEGTITSRKITAHWTMGREKAVAMLLTGDVANSGGVTIEMEMHKQTVDGERLATIDVVGTLQDGVIEAKGSFRNGRGATLNWRKNQE
jgi:class 3 adenylate cyclase